MRTWPWLAVRSDEAACRLAPSRRRGGGGGAAAERGRGHGPQAVVGPPRGTPVGAAALEARTREVSALLRCPVCQGLSVADSPATMAMKMKAEVREMVAAGYDQDQILAYFERSYGEFVRLKPPLRGVNWLVWLAPALGLVLGLVVVAWALRAPTETAEDATPSSASAGEADAPPDDPALVPYLSSGQGNGVRVARGRPARVGALVMEGTAPVQWLPPVAFVAVGIVLGALLLRLVRRRGGAEPAPVVESLERARPRGEAGRPDPPAPRARRHARSSGAPNSWPSSATPSSSRPPAS